jgi:H/ACA ribonucleoprotein complex subunit 4
MSVAKGTEDEYSIKPQATTPALDTSNWPLLLKNYEKRMAHLSSDTYPMIR